MPPGAGSLASLLAEALHEPATSATRSRHRTDASFYLVNCANGFKCVSKVDAFGTNHDGEYKLADPSKTIASDLRGTYEEGCPAKGKYSNSMGCVDNEFGKGTSLCWANDRYDSGSDSPCTNPDTCMCVKPTENGDKVHLFKHSIKEGGQEKVMQSYVVQMPQDCEKCETYNHNETQCENCAGCEYGDREVKGTMIKGCYDRNPDKPRQLEDADEEPGRLYLDGQSGQEKTLTVLPHYPLWDPGDKPDMPGESHSGDNEGTTWKFPWNSRRPSYSQDTWLEKYKEAAPRIQRRMDLAAKHVVKYGEDLDNPGTCRTSQIGCLQAIPQRLLHMRVVKNECLNMQKLEMSLRKGDATLFDASVPSKKNAGGNPVNCRMGGGGKCQMLNCYTTDRAVVSGVKCIKQKLRDCKQAIIADQRSKDEEEAGIGMTFEDEDEKDAPDGSESFKAPSKGLANKITNDVHGQGETSGAKDETAGEEAKPAPSTAAEGSDAATDGSEGANPGEKEAMQQAQAAAAAEKNAEDSQLADAEAAVKAMPGLEEAAKAEADAAEGGEANDAQQGLQLGEGVEAQEEANTSVAAEGGLRQPGQQSLEGAVKAGSMLWSALGAVHSSRGSSQRHRTTMPRCRQDQAYRDFLCVCP